MATLDDPKSKTCFRSMREMREAQWKTLDPKTVVLTLEKFYWVFSFSSIALPVYGIVIGPDRAGVLPMLIAPIFMVLAQTLARFIQVIKHFDERISQLEAAVKGRDARDNPECDHSREIRD